MERGREGGRALFRYWMNSKELREGGKEGREGGGGEY